MTIIKGKLGYDSEVDRYTVVTKDEVYDLHCGDTFAINLEEDKYIDTRIEMSSDWYLIDIKTPIKQLIGQSVQLYKS